MEIVKITFREKGNKADNFREQGNMDPAPSECLLIEDL